MTLTIKNSAITTYVDHDRGHLRLVFRNFRRACDGSTSALPRHYRTAWWDGSGLVRKITCLLCLGSGYLP